MIRATITILLVMKLTFEECLQGCLKCNERDECLFCDFKNNFKIQGISCQAVTVTNCNLIDISGNCLLCKEKFYLDKATNKCVEMKSGDLDVNCAINNAPAECQACVAGFFIFEGKCTAIAAPVSNCTLADSSNSSKCLTCAKGFILAPDRGSCVKIADVDNCASYSVASCSTCKSGFLLNSNKYMEDIYQLKTTENQFNLLTKVNYDDTGFQDQGYFATCSKLTITNCAVVSDVDKCKTCNPGYFLDDKFQCQIYPLEGIANCVVYAAASICIECAKNFYPQTPANCTAITQEPNCVQYNPRSISTVCIACVKEYYLNSDQKCIVRDSSKEITKCDITNPTADLCQSCAVGFTITDDKLSCLPEITMCQIYATSSKATQEMLCSKCKNGFYFDTTSKKCITGGIDNCEVFKSTENKCATCKNGYYLAAEVCLKHSLMANCTTYEAITSNKCAVCDINFFLFEPLTACVKATTIEKCLINDDILSCGICQDGYKVSSTKICELITTPTNCLQVSGSACTKCMTGFYIENGSCVVPIEVFSTHCLISNANGIIDKSVLACSYCKSNALPFNYKSSYICMNKNRFDQTKIKDKCLSYKIDESGTYTCTKCVDNKVLMTDGTCDNSCLSTEVLKMVEVFNYVTPGSVSTDYDNFAVTRTRVCMTSTTDFNGCSHIYPDIFTHTMRTASEATYACRKCASGYYKYLVANRVTNIEDPDKASVPTSPVSAFPGVACKSAPTRASATAVIDFCEYYSEIVPGNWGCIKCQFGFSGVVVEYTSGTTGAYITSCQKITTCNDSVSNILEEFVKEKAEVDKYKTILGALYSCHVCLLDGSIPYLAITFSSTLLPKLAKYGLTEAATFGAGSGGWAVNCYSNLAATFGISPSTNYATVTDCGLGVINTASEMNAIDATITTPTAGRVGVFCYACKAGYKSTRIATDTMAPLMVSSCTQIANCQSSTWFNGCSKCNSGYAYKFNAITKSVEYDVCEAFTDANCFAVDPSGVSKVCKYCKPGYNLNADKVCESIIAVKCFDSNFLFPQVFDVLYTSDQHATGLYLMPNGPGCSKCSSSDDIGLFVSSDTYYCTDSPYLKTQVRAEGTKIINNCVNFSMNNANTAFVCKICKSGYIPSDPGNCVEKNAVPNCDQAKNSQQCTKCSTEYTVVNGLCVQKNIEKCLTYDESPTATQLACKVCETNYFPTPILCKLGNVVNCKLLTNANTCTECLPSFALVAIPQAKTYCFPIPDTLKCTTVDPTFFVQNKFKCTACKEGHVLSVSIDDFPKSTCMNFTRIDSCATYNYAPLLPDSSFTCKTCINGYFLNETFCQARNVTMRECVTYKTDKDECAECMAGTFLSVDGKSCISYPTGIKGCRIYKSLTECTGCNENLFFNKTQCDAIPANNTITKCIYYADLVTCTLCQQGFALSEGKCVASQATNCLTYESKTSCGSCYEKFGFKEENGIRSCVAIEDKNCLVYQPFYPFKCITCAPEFFSLNGVCTAVTTAVEYCLEYETATNCRKCKEGAALHFNKTLCSKNTTVISLFDPNCSEMKWIFNPTCTKCKPSFFFVNGTCTKCTNNTIENGCYNCNPKNQTLCYMCKTGYFQSKDSKCTEVTSAVTNNTNLTNTTNTTAGDGIAYKAIYVLYMVFTLMAVWK